MARRSGSGGGRWAVQLPIVLPWFVWLPLWLLVGLWRLLVLLARRLWSGRWPVLAGTVGLAGLWVAVDVDRAARTAGLLLVVGVAAFLWFLLDRASWWRWLGLPVLSRWRARRYRSGWVQVMVACGLAYRYQGALVVPDLGRVYSTRDVDWVQVGLTGGYLPEDLARQVARFATAFGALGCKVAATGHPSVARLIFQRTEPLAKLVAPFPIPNPVDLLAVPMAVTEDGRVWRLRLLGSHVLIGGATGAGKGSVLWSLLRALCTGIRAGLVQVWAVDPKDGVELTFGAPLFARFVYQSPEAMADLFEQAVALMRERGGRMRGVTRQHVPTVVEPLIVIVIDEIGSLTAYLGDAKLGKRIGDALRILLSRGRALGVQLVAAVQDPRKETVPMRGLFSTKIALRLAEAAEVDLVLGDGARDLGALCDRIPKTAPGVGYVRLDDDPIPVRVRFSHLTDTDIAQMTRDYQSPTATAGGDAE